MVTVDCFSTWIQLTWLTQKKNHYWLIAVVKQGNSKGRTLVARFIYVCFVLWFCSLSHCLFCVKYFHLQKNLFFNSSWESVPFNDRKISPRGVFNWLETGWNMIFPNAQIGTYVQYCIYTQSKVHTTIYGTHLWDLNFFKLKFFT